MKRRDLLRHLEAHGCRFLREGANHTVYRQMETLRHSVIPRHTEIKPHLVRKICQALGIPAPLGR